MAVSNIKSKSFKKLVIAKRFVYKEKARPYAIFKTNSIDESIL